MMKQQIEHTSLCCLITRRYSKYKCLINLNVAVKLDHLVLGVERTQGRRSKYRRAETVG